MGVERKIDSGNKDSLGRVIRVSGRRQAGGDNAKAKADAVRKAHHVDGMGAGRLTSQQDVAEQLNCSDVMHLAMEQGFCDPGSSDGPVGVGDDGIVRVFTDGVQDDSPVVSELDEDLYEEYGEVDSLGVQENFGVNSDMAEVAVRTPDSVIASMVTGRTFDATGSNEKEYMQEWYWDNSALVKDYLKDTYGCDTYEDGDEETALSFSQPLSDIPVDPADMSCEVAALHTKGRFAVGLNDMLNDRTESNKEQFTEWLNRKGCRDEVDWESFEMMDGISKWAR